MFILGGGGGGGVKDIFLEGRTADVIQQSVLQIK